MLELKFAELHNPLFLAGKNFGLKLDPAHAAGLTLNYDREEKELLVEWRGEIGIIPSSNIACMVVGQSVKRVEQVHHAMTATPQSAQVESPMSHVFAGSGHGKTGKSK